MRRDIKIERMAHGYVATLKGKPITDIVSKSAIHKAIDAYLKADNNSDGAVTVKEIKSRLDALGVDYPKQANKTKLSKLLTEAELEKERE